MRTFAIVFTRVSVVAGFASMTVEALGVVQTFLTPARSRIASVRVVSVHVIVAVTFVAFAPRLKRIAIVKAVAFLALVSAVSRQTVAFEIAGRFV